jgi:putative intracellular protease/amidase
MDARRRTLLRVELAHLALALVAVGVALVWAGDDVVIGLGSGFVIGGLNARAMAMLAAGATSSDAATRSRSAALLFVKMIALMTAVGGVLYALRPDVIAFVAAISAAPLLLLVSGLVLGAPAGAEPQTEPAVEAR